MEIDIDSAEIFLFKLFFLFTDEHVIYEMIVVRLHFGAKLPED